MKILFYVMVTVGLSSISFFSVSHTGRGALRGEKEKPTAQESQPPSAVDVILAEDSKNKVTVQRAQSAEEILKSTTNLDVETELALVSALPNERAKNILLSKKTLSLETELALVAGLDGYKLSAVKEILQNLKSKKAFYGQTQMVLVEKLSHRQARKSRPAFKVLQGTKFHQETKRKLIELLPHSHTQKPAKRLLLSSDLKLSLAMQNQLISYLSSSDSNLSGTAKDILFEMGLRGHIAPTIQKLIVTEFVFDPINNEKRLIGVNILSALPSLSLSAKKAIKMFDITKLGTPPLFRLKKHGQKFNNFISKYHPLYQCSKVFRGKT